MDPVPNSFPSSLTVSQEEFTVFHKMDRELYTILVFALRREPSESMQVLALWLWLERVGFRSVVDKIIALPIILINEVAEETITCLNYINNVLTASYSVENMDIPLLQNILDKELTFQFLYENRVDAIEGVAKMVQEVCLRAFTDIMQQAIIRNTNERMAEEAAVAQQNIAAGQSNTQNNNGGGNFWFGTVGPANMRTMQNNNNNNNGGGGGGEGVGAVVPADERTMFVTFSKGYRVEEWEVREFLRMAYGDCVEALYMQEVPQYEQALFARIVFHSETTIDRILRGAIKAKFTINGKHVWARKFVPKHTRTGFMPVPVTSTNLPRDGGEPSSSSSASAN